MLRHITRCAVPAASSPPTESMVICRTCQAVHLVDWTDGWPERMDEFCSRHYEDHGAFQFGIFLRP
jgi:hypothetical protein